MLSPFTRPLPTPCRPQATTRAAYLQCFSLARESRVEGAPMRHLGIGLFLQTASSPFAQGPVNRLESACAMHPHITFNLVRPGVRAGMACTCGKGGEVRAGPDCRSRPPGKAGGLAAARVYPTMTTLRGLGAGPGRGGTGKPPDVCALGRQPQCSPSLRPVGASLVLALYQAQHMPLVRGLCLSPTKQCHSRKSISTTYSSHEICKVQTCKYGMLGEADEAATLLTAHAVQYQHEVPMLVLVHAHQCLTTKHRPSCPR